MALSADAIRKTRNRKGTKIGQYPIATRAVIYVGSLVAVNTSTGRAVAATDATARKFLGVATKGGTGDASGTVDCEFEYGCEALIDAAAALTTAYIGANCAIADDDQVTTNSAATNGLLVGEVTQIEDGDAWVALRSYATAAV